MVELLLISERYVIKVLPSDKSNIFDPAFFLTQSVSGNRELRVSYFSGGYPGSYIGRGYGYSLIWYSYPNWRNY